MATFLEQFDAAEADAEKRLLPVQVDDLKTLEEIDALTYTYVSLATTLIMETPPSRELSLALTALEESKFWAVRAICLNGIRTLDDYPSGS